jgi:predicted nucleic acid-binding protein
MSRGMTASGMGPGNAEVRYLVDTSALARMSHHTGVRSALATPLMLGVIACCDVTRLEMGVTARNADDHQELGDMLAALPAVSVVPMDFDRAFTVQGLLAGGGHHRGVGLPDLIIAACAERLGLIVIHCDGDFDLIAQVTGQPTRWVVEREML